MSDSEAADLPPEPVIARKLRDIVISIHESGNTDSLTVKRVRNRAEEELGLADGFLKSDKSWKHKSHDLIHEAVEKYCGDNAEPQPERAAAPTKGPKNKAPPKNNAATDGPRGVKRAAAAPPKKTQKRRKTVSSSDDSDVQSPPPQKPVQRRKKLVVDDEEEEEEEEAAPNGTIQTTARKQNDHDVEEEAALTEKLDGDAEMKVGLSDSEMSSLIDDDPAPKRKRQKKSPSGKAKAGAESTRPKAKATKTAKDDDPEVAEIKRLQGWLVKCGIRKVWSKELASYDSSKEKIRHLRVMLKDAGMEGKFSTEKAATIKEQREFAKDLEAIQEGAKHWGQLDEPATGGRPTRRAAARVVKKVVVPDPEDSEDDEGKDSDGEDDDHKESEDDEDNGSAEDESSEVEDDNSNSDSD